MLRIATRLYEEVPADLEIIRAYNALPARRRRNWFREVLAAGFQAMQQGEVPASTDAGPVDRVPLDKPLPVRLVEPAAHVNAAPAIPLAPVGAQASEDEPSEEPKKVHASVMAGFFRS